MSSSSASSDGVVTPDSSSVSGDDEHSSTGAAEISSPMAEPYLGAVGSWLPLTHPSPAAADPPPTLADPSPPLADPSPTVTDPSPTVTDPSPTVTDPSPTAADLSPTFIDLVPTVTDPSPTVADSSPTLAKPRHLVDIVVDVDGNKITVISQIDRICIRHFSGVARSQLPKTLPKKGSDKKGRGKKGGDKKVGDKKVGDKKDGGKKDGDKKSHGCHDDQSTTETVILKCTAAAYPGEDVFKLLNHWMGYNLTIFIDPGPPKAATQIFEPGDVTKLTMYSSVRLYAAALLLDLSHTASLKAVVDKRIKNHCRSADDIRFLMDKLGHDDTMADWIALAYWLKMLVQGASRPDAEVVQLLAGDEALGARFERAREATLKANIRRRVRTGVYREEDVPSLIL